MAQRLLARSTGGALTRALATRSAIRSVAISTRTMATAKSESDAAKSSEVSPKAKAMSIIDALPGNSIITKTGYITVGTALATALVSKEIYVLNEETLVLVSFVGLMTALARSIRHPFNEWVKDQGKMMTDVLAKARQQHREMVSSKIEETTQMNNVVDVTKHLFAMSKEMAEMEAKIFELKQKAALSQESKSVLDSWVRYESALRERDQRLVADQVVERVRVMLEDSKMQNQILAQAVADVEKIASRKA